MTRLIVTLLGKFRVRVGETNIPKLEARKAQELFCYLLLHRNRQHSRETLASLLWGSQANEGRAKKQLRQALWQLQSALAPYPTARKTLLIETEWILVNPEAELWLDIALLEERYLRFKNVPGTHLSQAEVPLLEEAAAVYCGDLLEDCYQDWCLLERARFQNMYWFILDKLMDYCAAHQQCEAGLTYGHCLLRYDQAHERTHRRLMTFYYLQGDRTAALRQYERCVAALHNELGVKPALATVQLYEDIRAERLPLAANVLSVGPAHAPHRTWPGLLERLRQMEITLNECQRQLREEIQALEKISQHLSTSAPTILSTSPRDD